MADRPLSSNEISKLGLSAGLATDRPLSDEEMARLGLGPKPPGVVASGAMGAVRNVQDTITGLGESIASLGKVQTYKDAFKRGSGAVSFNLGTAKESLAPSGIAKDLKSMFLPPAESPEEAAAQTEHPVAYGAGTVLPQIAAIALAKGGGRLAGSRIAVIDEAAARAGASTAAAGTRSAISEAGNTAQAAYRGAETLRQVPPAGGYSPSAVVLKNQLEAEQGAKAVAGLPAKVAAKEEASQAASEAIRTEGARAQAIASEQTDFAAGLRRMGQKGKELVGAAIGAYAGHKLFPGSWEALAGGSLSGRLVQTALADPAIRRGIYSLAAAGGQAAPLATPLMLNQPGQRPVRALRPAFAENP